ncbi:MAG TPA: Ppx/GppA family phosphatase [Acetobacteraceae bacterium]|nr:Ppx/GppA family phosphatase [Acetobacteraceae bacterium]
MPYAPPVDAPRCAVVDLGSNSVRLVVFEGRSRNPLTIFNEKAVLRLGRGLVDTGRLNAEGMQQALTVLHRYQAVAHAMGAAPFEVLGTAAVRDAENGIAFVAALEQAMPGVSIRILTGEQEARLSAEGVLCGIPEADGVLADVGGGSLELVRLRGGTVGEVCTLPLGVIRLAERVGGDLAAARSLVDAELGGVPWLREAGEALYLVGGAWRAMARIHIAQTAYPLAIVHHYAIDRDAARDLAGAVAGASRRALERLPGLSRRRIDDLPFAAVVMRRLVRVAAWRQVVFSANGLREGWYMRQMPAALRGQDPVLAAGRDSARRLGRDPTLPAALIEWIAPLFADEDAAALRLREAACWMSDIGSHDHPEYRAEQTFLRVLRQPGVALGHPERAFLALTLALRYEAEPEAPFLRPARLLLETGAARQAEIIGLALRLAYTLSAGTPDLLARTALRREERRLSLLLSGGGVFGGEAVMRRLDRLAQAVGLEPVIEAG